ncbi:MAG: DUF4202 family protein [Patescibacteria group bacterium]|jgi:mutator protein MutT
MAKNIKKVNNVSLIVFYDPKGKIMLQDRRGHSKVGEEWGFFGGHIEEGETPEQTLIREIQEELDIAISDYKYIGEANTLINNVAVNRHVYIAPIGEKEPEINLKEGHGCKFFTINSAKNLKMVPGDEKAVELVGESLEKLMPDLLEKSIEFVDKSFGKKSPHFERALYWVKILKPDADEALQIAAYCHDIDRSTWMNSKDRPAISKKLMLQDLEAIREHEEHGAEMMYDFLVANGADESLAEKVRHLISRHEEGDDDEQNVLKDADSISYFETNAERHIAELGTFTFHELKSKTDYMFNRITSPEAKKLAEPNYKSAIEKLEKAAK